MIALARKTLLHEWRRFLPALLAVALSALLLLVQAALVQGIFGSAAVFVQTSGAQLWAGYPGTRSVDLGRAIPADTELVLRQAPGVRRVEPFRWIDADWRAGSGALSIYVSGIDTQDQALMFRALLNTAQRQLLREPESVIVDRADLDKLGVSVGGAARINGRRVRVVAALDGLRALGAPIVLASLDTAARLQPQEPRYSYYLADLHRPEEAARIQARLAPQAQALGFELWTREAFAQKSVQFWMLETGAGLAVIFLAIVVALVGALITSQTLMAAVAGSRNEYATLNALGVGRAALSRVVLEQAGWIGVGGLLLGALLSALALALARSHAVPVEIHAGISALCALSVLIIALVSGLAALRTLRHSDPASLLR
ncbi:UNVERIFIED_ORG: ABC transporter permease [Shinella sp. XGS7]|nr:FtsX-like permease family protein [Shinella sp. XGS7]